MSLHIRSEFHRGIFTILDNAVTVGESVEVKNELAGLNLTQETSKKEKEGSAINSAAVDFAKVRWQ